MLQPVLTSSVRSSNLKRLAAGDVVDRDDTHATCLEPFMKITRRRRHRRPSKFAFLIVCSGIALLGWIGMAEPESGVATVHWIGPQGPKPARGPVEPEPAPAPEPEQPLSLFNDASGRPDPHGIMWIDPLQIVHRFPEKYGGCFFGKEK